MTVDPLGRTRPEAHVFAHYTAEDPNAATDDAVRPDLDAAIDRILDRTPAAPAVSNGAILIVTNPGDVTAHAVDRLLRHRGHQAAFLDYSDVLHGRITVQQTGPAWTAAVSTTAGTPVDLTAVGAVWWRIPVPVNPMPWLTENEQAFTAREADHVSQGLLAVLMADPAIYWRNDPVCTQRANYKIEQMHRAAGMGFTVPRTLITNQPDEVQAFRDSCLTGIVFKTLSNRLIGPEFKPFEIGEDGPVLPPMAFTTLLTDEHLQHVNSLQLCPGFFQEYVPKDHELRVTVIDDQVFPAAIDSQQHPQTVTDYRRAADSVCVTPAELPAELEDRCRRLLRSYGLAYGAFDFIVTPTGDHVFLELNPHGEWINLVYQQPELRIAEAFTDTLVRAISKTTG